MTQVQALSGACSEERFLKEISIQYGTLVTDMKGKLGNILLRNHLSCFHTNENKKQCTSFTCPCKILTESKVKH